MLYSLDNAPTHKFLIPGEYDVGPILKLPPYSPDLHKVVEHQHALIKRVWYSRIRKQFPNEATREEAQELLQQVIKDVVKQDVIERDMISLNRTYCRILELEGDYPEAEFR